jgi:uncharacterized protein YydD (DUF2326 family)
MIINPVTVKFSRHHLEAARRVIELAIANRATGKARRNSLEDALDAIDAALKDRDAKNSEAVKEKRDVFAHLKNSEAAQEAWAKGRKA